MTAPIPVTVIGGYLGAGKTTLVNQMLRQADGLKLAVLVNEFGELPIDEDLIEAQDDDLISIAGGCICCSFGSDLSAALIKLAGARTAPDHIIIEASGVALPGSIAHTISILPAFRVEGICVLADCANARTLAQDEYVGDTIERQFSDADLLILTKSDLVEPSGLAQMQSWLSDHWPAPRHVIAAHGQAPNDILLGHFPPHKGRVADQHHDAAYESVFVQFPNAINARALAQQIATEANGVLRAKGIVQDLAGQPALIQIVGPRHDVSWAAEAASPGLVCIGRKGQLDKARLRTLAAELA